ncbi:HAMP domain-containing sensor histidine kinase [Pedococcus sp.]|uniref:sensor histidine kinase n=1 Tax=Pedococcus sp. TaxID=2860345 RepID=UPI002E124A3A|nr:HAMP domain-containing sensor histidine kinase [Pedococcus sp.]
MTPPAEGTLLRRAAWSVSAQTALAVAMVVVIVSLGVVVLFDHQQATEIRGLVRQTATKADDVNDPPVGIWLVRVTGASRTASPGTPAAVVGARQLAEDPPGLVSVDTAGSHWTAWVDARGDGVRFAAVYDQSRHIAEEHRIVDATTLAGLVGVILAAGIGLLVGRRAVRPLGSALQLQRRFVADASHELRTPLAVVHTRAQMVRRHLAADASPRQRAELDQLVADTESLGEVVSDLLLAAQLEHTQLAHSRVDLAELAEEVGASMRPYAEQAGVHLDVAVEGGRSDGLVVSGAPTALRRALTALVDNAIAHSSSGGAVCIRLQADGAGPFAQGRAAGMIRVSVEDHGDGLDPTEATRLTQRFARGEPTSAGGGRRFGLGLALVDEVVRAHQGRLEIAGAPGEGSSFTLHLPGAADAGTRAEADG